MAKKFLTSITISASSGGEYTFPIADGTANQAIITDGDGNLSFGSAIASSAEDAQRLVCEMINASGSTIGAFMPVCCVGMHSDGTPEIAPARADNALFMPAIGVTQASVGNNNRTDVLLYGKIENVNTTAYQTGDTLYVAPTGGWITTRPTGNNYIQAVLKVGRVHANNGSGGAFGAGKYEDLPNLGTGKIWVGDSSSYPVATSIAAAVTAAYGYTPADDSGVVKLTGNQTVAGVKTFTASLLANNPSEGATGEGLIAGRSFKIDATATGQRAEMYVVSDILSNTYGSGLIAQYANFTGDKAFGFNLNTAGGFELYVKNTSFGKALAIANTMAATFGNSVTATSFIKTGGTSAQFLKADGSVDSSTYLTTGTADSTYLPLSGGTLTGVLSVNSAIRVKSGSPNGILLETYVANQLKIRITPVSTTFDMTMIFPIGASRNYTYPSSDGTIALTSDIPSVAGVYLPLSGGTLTGALSGTSATFSGDVSAINSGFQGRYARIYEASAQRGGLYPYNVISGAGTDYSIGLFSESSLWFAAGGGVTKHLIIESTGTATFSGGNLQFLGTATGLAGAYFANDNTSFRIHSTYGGGTTKDLIIQSGGSADAPKLILKLGGQVQFTSYTSATSYSGTAAGYLAFDSSGNVITVAGVAATDNTKLPLAGGTMTGVIAFSNLTGNKIDFYFSGEDRYGIQVQSSELRIHSGAQGAASGGITFGKSTSTTFTEAMRIRNDGAVQINGRIILGSFPNSTSNSGEAWIGRASDRNPGTMTVQLGGGSATDRKFEVVDFAWSVVLFNVNSDGNVFANSSFRAPNFRFTNSTNNAYLTGNADWGFRAVNDNGYIQFGPANGSWTHIYSDKNFYFNQELYVNAVQVVKNSGTWAINITGTAGSAPNGSNINNYYNCAAGEGYGFRFWNGAESYKLSMGAAAEYQYGPVSDYSIKLHMGEGANRGITMGRTGSTPTFAHNTTSGNTQVAGTFNASGTVTAGLAQGFLNANYQAGYNRIWAFATALAYGIGYYQGGVDYIGFHFGATASPQFIFNQNGTANFSSTVTAPTFSGALSGNASTATSLTSANFISQRGSNGSWNADFSAAPAGTATYGGDLSANTVNGPGGSWWIQQNFRHTNASNLWGVQVAWGWEDNPNRLATRSVSAGTFGGWVYYLNSANVSSYALPIGGGTLGGALTVNGNITMGSGGASSIYMRDSDEGTRELHCNSNRIGFLTQAGAWGAYCDDSGNFFAANLSGTNTGDQTNISGTAGNVTSISSATGNNYNWTGLNYFVSNRNTPTDSAPLQAYSNNGSGAIMSFHRGGYYAVNFGLDSDNVMRIGGWSAGVNRWQLDMSGNQTVAGNMTAGGSIYSANWFYSEGNAGWYNNTYGQGLRQSKGNVSYGNVITVGENFNGWSGYNAQNTYTTCFMQNSSGTHGFYQEGGGNGWTAFYNFGNQCWGLGNDATDPAYSLHIIKYGGSNTGWIIWSDRRIKENIKTIDNALDKVLALRGVYYNKIDDPNKERCVGYIAQEVMEVVPELVVYSEELDMYNMNYAPMVGMLTEAMKEQQAQIEELKQQVQTLLNS